jgi:hypothetical protein
MEKLLPSVYKQPETSGIVHRSLSILQYAEYKAPLQHD